MPNVRVKGDDGDARPAGENVLRTASSTVAPPLALRLNEELGLVANLSSSPSTRSENQVAANPVNHRQGRRLPMSPR
jgi:hypothetical protein